MNVILGQLGIHGGVDQLQSKSRIDGVARDRVAPGNEDDRQKAMQLLDESLQISTELGMRPLMERVLSRREILKA